MTYVWHDYDPHTMSFVENWLDENAVNSTGLDEGFRAFYEYWANEDGFVPGENFWCKVVFEGNHPFAVIAFCRHEHKIIIMELLVASEKRGQRKGSALLKELLRNEGILGFHIQKSEAVIYPDNIASQKAFENAGFRYHHNRQDGNGDSMIYVYERSFSAPIDHHIRCIDRGE